MSAPNAPGLASTVHSSTLSKSNERAMESSNRAIPFPPSAVGVPPPT